MTNHNTVSLLSPHNPFKNPILTPPLHLILVYSLCSVTAENQQENDNEEQYFRITSKDTAVISAATATSS